MGYYWLIFFIKVKNIKRVLCINGIIIFKFYFLFIDF